MEYFVYNIDEYRSLENCNEYSPTWPFRMIVTGSSDSGKTTMIMNLLMGNKKVKEDGMRYIPCNDIILIGKHLNEPKWEIVQEFYDELAENGEDVSFKSVSPYEIPDVSEFDSNRSSIVIFEDLINESKKIQEQISSYFTHGRHSNISPIYVTQRFFAVPKTIRENITYISLHRGGGSLSDIKKIVSQYTEESDTIASVIDDLTLKKEFIVFDLRRNKDDPLSIRVRWDTSLRLFLNQSQIITDKYLRPSQTILDEYLRPSQIISDQSQIITDKYPSKFSIYGQKVIMEAKKNNTLRNLYKGMLSPKERKKMLADGVITKNSEIWSKYIFQEAFGINSKELGDSWHKFIKDVNTTPIDKDSQLLHYKHLIKTKPLDDKKYIESCSILLWLFSNEHIDQSTFYEGIKELDI